MSRRAALLLIGCLCVVILALVWNLRDTRPARVPVETASKVEVRYSQPARSPLPDPAVARTIIPRAEGRVLPPEAEALARTLNAPDGSAEQDVQTLSSLVELFRRANQGAIPAGGLNEEITEQLLGKITHHFAVLPPDCPGLDGAGRLLDRWGNPYFLHPLSREVLEIRSAGPDGKFGTADDVVVGDEAGREIRR